MSVLSIGNTRGNDLTFFPIGNMTFVPGLPDNEDALKQRAIQMVTNLWPAHKALVMLPTSVIKRAQPGALQPLQHRNPLVVNLRDHEAEHRDILIWPSESNVLPAVALQEGIVASISGYDHNAMIRVGIRQAVFGGIIADFYEHWLRTGERGDVRCCFITPFINAELVEVTGTELELVRSSRLSRFLKPISRVEEERFGFDLSPAVEYQLEHCFGRGEVTILNSVADHFGQPTLSNEQGNTKLVIHPTPPTPGLYLGACA